MVRTFTSLAQHLSFIVATAVTLLALAGAVVIENLERGRLDASARSEILAQLNILRTGLEAELTESLLLSRGVAAYITAQGDISQTVFEKMAATLFGGSAKGRFFTVTRGTIIDMVYPTESNQRAIGLDLRSNPEMWPSAERAIQTRTPGLCGPVKLVQGGSAIILRNPIFVSERQGDEERFFGFVNVLVGVDNIFGDIRRTAERLNLDIAIRGRDGLGARGDVIFGDEGIFAQNPVLTEVSLSYGKFLMAAVGKGGWDLAGREKIRLTRLLSFSLILLVGVATFGVALYQRRRRRDEDAIRLHLETEVAERTEKLEDSLHAVRQSEERFSLAMEACNDGLWDWNIATGGAYFSPAYFRMLGYEPDEFDHNSITWINLIHPDDKQNVLSVAQECIDNLRQRISVEFRMKAKDGSWKWILGRGHAVSRDMDGRALRMVGTNFDVTQRKRSEGLLQARLRLSDFSFSHSEHELMVATLDEACALTVSETGFFHFLLLDQETLTLQAWSTKTLETYCQTEGSGLHYDVGAAGIWADAVRLRQSVVCNDYQSNTGRKGLPEGHAEVTRFMSIPIFRDDNIVAILGVGNKATHYDAADQYVVELLGDMAWDIVVRKRAEKELYEARATLQAAMDCSPAGIAIADAPDGKLRYINDAGLHIRGDERQNIGAGVAPDQYVKKLHDLNGQPLKADEAPLVQAIISGKPCRRELIIRRAAGDDRTIIANAAPILDKKGVVTAGVAIFTDITETKARENELSERREQLKFVLEGSDLGFWDWTLDTGEVQRNARWAEMLGYTIDEIDFTVRQWIDFVHPDDKEGALRSITEHLDGLTPQHKFEYRMQTKDGQYRWILDQAKVVTRAPNGRPLRMSGTHTDVTERKKMEHALTIAKDELQALLLERTTSMEKAQQASQAKSIFLSTMSHELRTPLNSIIGFTELVSSQSFGPIGDHQYIEHSEYAYQSAQHLLDMINEILDLSKIEARTMQLEQIRVPVKDTFLRSIRMVDTLAQQAGVTIKLAVSPNIPELWADERAVRQIIINLLSNAIKFNHDGGSILLAALESDKFIEIVVSDTGTGIPDEALERVFRPFEQIRNEYNRAHGGTGLGLAIVEGLVKLHGGTVAVASEVGKGTAMTVRLPAFTGGASAQERHPV